MRLERVLLAEDDLDIQKVVRMSLQFRGVANIVVVSDGQECLKVVNQVNPEVILLDVMMPQLDGYETCRRLKSDPQTAAIPVIFLTAKAQQFEMRQGLQAGAIGYLTKPFDPMTLHDQIIQLLDESRSSSVQL
jgi:CheY-like chemotaxis protein